MSKNEPKVIRKEYKTGNDILNSIKLYLDEKLHLQTYLSIKEVKEQNSIVKGKEWKSLNFTLDISGFIDHFHFRISNEDIDSYHISLTHDRVYDVPPEDAEDSGVRIEKEDIFDKIIRKSEVSAFIDVLKVLQFILTVQQSGRKEGQSFLTYITALKSKEEAIGRFNNIL